MKHFQVAALVTSIALLLVSGASVRAHDAETFEVPGLQVDWCSSPEPAGTRSFGMSKDGATAGQPHCFELTADQVATAILNKQKVFIYCLHAINQPGLCTREKCDNRPAPSFSAATTGSEIVERDYSVDTSGLRDKSGRVITGNATVKVPVGRFNSHRFCMTFNTKNTYEFRYIVK